MKAKGDRLPTERDLAREFGVSRTVVRDTVKTLAGRGILRVKHGVGIFVSVHSSANWDKESLQGAALTDLFEIRKVLESEGAVWAAQRGKPHHVERMGREQNRFLRIIPCFTGRT